jgi:predicted transposase YbfD/YdcC
MASPAQGFSKVEIEAKQKNLNLLLWDLLKNQITKEVLMQDHITLEGVLSEGVVFDVDALMEHLQQVSDQRSRRGIRYSLPFLLSIIVLAKLCGQNKPTAIAEWMKLREKLLVSAFNRERETVPSLNTIRRTLAETVIATELHEVFKRFLHQAYGGQQSILVILDGKTLRGTIPKGETSGLHLLAAYLPEEGIVLMQVAVDSKESELTAAPRIVASLDLRGRIVCGDAMFTQRDLSAQVLYEGGDYIWFVKDNQPRLKEDVEQFFTPPRKTPGWHAPELEQDQAQTTEKGHGRLEQRTLTAIADDSGFIDWPGLQQVFKLERKVTQTSTGAIAVDEVVGITSLSAEKGSAKQLLEWTRGLWGIENGLHYRRDVTLNEDGTRMSNDNLAEAMAVLNNFVIGLTSKLGFRNLASAQRVFDARLTLTLSSYG